MIDGGDELPTTPSLRRGQAMTFLTPCDEGRHSEAAAARPGLSSPVHFFFITTPDEQDLVPTEKPLALVRRMLH
jgi:hypothetical protein